MSKPEKRAEQLIAFLKSAIAYPHRPAAIHLIETHISWLFIASPFVFKVKKPVNLGFVDFSTLDKRRYFCERELQLNRRLCAEVYLEVVPIYRSNASFSFIRGDAVAEYALKMRELPGGFFLNELLAGGAVGEEQIVRVIARLHEFYKSETPGPEIEEWGRPEKLRISTDENFAQIEPFVGKFMSSLAFESIRHFTNGFYGANERLFAKRIEQRRILDCHGDLRLDHVHITPEAVSIFDCIEFNDRFRFIDIANDLAFLAMDFDFERRRDLANLLLHHAAREFGDPGILRLADFYKCYRAVVRGKVESIQATAEERGKQEAHAARASRYFRLALRYASTGSEPLLLVVMGRIATGKTTVARRLASELDWPTFSSDQIRKTRAGLALRQRTPAELRDKIYSEQMTKQTYRELLSRGAGAVAAQGGAVIDATFSRRQHRDRLRDECGKAGIRYQIIEVEADDAEIRNRLTAREASTSESSDARLEDFAKLSAAYERPLEVPELIRVSALGDISETATAVMLRLVEKRLQRPPIPSSIP